MRTSGTQTEIATHVYITVFPSVATRLFLVKSREIAIVIQAHKFGTCQDLLPLLPPPTVPRTISLH